MFIASYSAIRSPRLSSILPRMPRATRPYHPGSAFHIVSRTQGREHWFSDDLKDTIAEILLTGSASAGARTIAFAVMSNHFHLLLFQGTEPLGWTMQPILRRIAVLVQKTQKREGHVFERRFRAKLCGDAEHLPNAILYIHRNPVEAEICRQPSEYRWSSARAYDGAVPPGLLCVNDGLRAFDVHGGSSLVSLHEIYKNRLERTADAEMSSYWDWFTQRIHRRSALGRPIPNSPHMDRVALRDLRDVAKRIIYSIDPKLDVDLIRSRYGGPHIVAARTQVIAALLQRGYPGCAIARYMRVSQATVSKIRSAMRWGSLKAMRG